MISKKITSLLASLTALNLGSERRQLIRLAAELPDISDQLKLIPDDKSKPSAPTEDWEEAAKEFGSETVSEDEYLQQIAPQPYSKDDREDSNHSKNRELVFRLLKERGITPVSAGEINILGYGCFGDVIRAVYNGKPVVVKIALLNGNDASLYSNLSKDFANWNAILTLRKSMPPEIKKHIPEIYFIDEGETGDGWDKYSYNIVVMEEMSPLNSDIDYMFGGFDRYSLETVNAIWPKIMEKVNESLQNNRMLPIDLAPPTSIGKRTPYFEKDELSNYIINAIIAEHPGTSPNDLKSEISWILLNKDLFRGYSSKHTFPRDKTVKPGYEPPAEFKGLLETVQWLKDHGIEWFDVKSQNVMLGNDGNVKLCDVGAFQVKK